jgi:hypothetical protein
MWADTSAGRWDDSFIAQLLDWLGYDGVAFFRMCMQEYKTVAPVWVEGKLPHPVHFREGMAVRNAMRRIHTELGARAYGAHFYDNHWQSAVRAALTMCEEGRPDEP